MTRVEQIMSRPVFTCRLGDTLDTAAALMWDHDCGAVPVVDEGGCLAGILTDRDICMAAYTKGLPLREIDVRTAMSSEVCVVDTSDPIERAERLMAEKQVRRIPVVDAQARPVGMVSVNDLVRTAVTEPQRGPEVDAVARTLAAVGQPRNGNGQRDQPVDGVPPQSTARERQTPRKSMRT